MPKNFIRFDKFEQATTTAKAAAEEETIAVRAKVVDETLRHAMPDAIHYLFTASSASSAISVSQSVSESASVLPAKSARQPGKDNLIIHTCMQLRTLRLSNLMAGRQVQRQQNND